MDPARKKLVFLGKRGEAAFFEEVVGRGSVMHRSFVLVHELVRQFRR